MTRHYCTLFDKNYMAKGLALHESLLKHSSEDFMLHILACDMDTFWLLCELKLQNAEVIPLEPFERALKLEPVRRSRSHQEYMWTLASSFMEYLLPWYDSICYLDADIYFYSDPKVIFDEVGERSIGITPHRFNDRDRRRLGGNGEFNVGVVVAQNSPVGLECISRWAGLCREWCFNRNETGRFGDQKYLDDWPQRYGDDVCVIENHGVNLGPWAVGNYSIGRFYGGTEVAVRETRPRETGKSTQAYYAPLLTCYHFHEFAGRDHLTNWKLRPEDKELIYEPYVEAYERALVKVREAIDSRQQPTEDVARA